MLSEKIDEVLATTSLISPQEIADAVLSRLSAVEKRSLLVEVLPGAVQTALSRRRMVSYVPAGSVDNHTESLKVRAIREHWASMLATPIPAVGKRLEDCTRTDVFKVVADLQARYKGLAAKIDWYLAIAAALPDDETTVGTLTEDPTGVAA